MRKVSFILSIGLSILALLLAGCSTPPRSNQPAQISTIANLPGTTTPPPADLMLPCDALPQFSGSNTNTSDLVGYNISLMQAYGKCSMKLKALQDWVTANH